MLFAVIVGVISALYFSLQKLYFKIKYFGGGVGKGVVADRKVQYTVFGEDGRYWTLFKSILDEFEKRETECDYLTMDPDDPALKAEYKYIHPSFIGEDNRAFAKLNMLSSKVCLATTPGLNVYQWKRSKGVDRYVHIFHSVDEGTAYRMFGMDYYDTILLTGPCQEYYIREMERMRGIPEKELKITGCTYLDALSEKASSGQNITQTSETKTVLLAPSWGDSAILSVFGSEIIDALLKTGYYIIIRPHPQMKKSEKELLDSLLSSYPGSENLEWDFDNDNFRSLSRADILISDFSSVMFDFAFVFNKPVIFAISVWDTAQYDAAWFDEPVWRIKILDELGNPLRKEDLDHMKDIIDDLIDNDDYRKGRDRVIEEAWQNRGHAAEAIVDYLESVS